MDSSGKLLIAMDYEVLKPTHTWNQFLKVYNLNFVLVKKNNKFGILGKDGHEILPFIFDSDFDLSYYFCVTCPPVHYFAVTINNKWGLYDDKGREIIPLKYDNKPLLNKNGYFEIKAGDQILFFDKEGKPLFEE